MPMGVPMIKRHLYFQSLVDFIACIYEITINPSETVESVRVEQKVKARIYLWCVLKRINKGWIDSKENEPLNK